MRKTRDANTCRKCNAIGLTRMRVVDMSSKSTLVNIAPVPFGESRRLARNGSKQGWARHASTLDRPFLSLSTDSETQEWLVRKLLSIPFRPCLHLMKRWSVKCWPGFHPAARRPLSWLLSRRWVGGVVFARGGLVLTKKPNPGGGGFKKGWGVYRKKSVWNGWLCSIEELIICNSFT